MRDLVVVKPEDPSRLGVLRQSGTLLARNSLAPLPALSSQVSPRFPTATVTLLLIPRARTGLPLRRSPRPHLLPDRVWVISRLPFAVRVKVSELIRGE